MAQNVIPTKGNLIATKKTLDLSVMGFDLLDRKKRVLVAEMMALIDKAKKLEEEMGDISRKAYDALRLANVSVGIVGDMVSAVPIDDTIKITYRSVMGVSIPKIEIGEDKNEPYFGLMTTTSRVDNAYAQFIKLKRNTVQLVEIEEGIYRLANAIRKTQKRANALQNVVIPNFRQTQKFISGYLEEKEREEFSRLKVIKKKNLQEITEP